MPMLETLENFMKLRKFKGYPQKENAISFWAFVFSIIFYVAIFCMFDIQPSTIINTTKFWFFISNTLILIIAADFGAFSSSSEQHDVYEEYVNKAQARTNSTFETHYMKIEESRNPEMNTMGTEEEIKDIVVDEKTTTDEVKLDIISRLQPVHHAEHVGPTPVSRPKDFPVINRDDVEDCSGILYDEKKEAAPPEVNEEKKKQAKCVRSNSDKAITVGTRETSEKQIQRSKSEKYYEGEVDQESGGFSTMSIEELNRRVEEFIRRSNRQIRLEAALETSRSFNSSHVYT